MTNMIASSFRHFDELQPLNDRQHLLECLSVTVEAPDVKTFTFKSDNQNWFRVPARPVRDLRIAGGAGSRDAHIYALIHPIAAFTIA